MQPVGAATGSMIPTLMRNPRWVFSARPVRRASSTPSNRSGGDAARDERRVYESFATRYNAGFGNVATTEPDLRSTSATFSAVQAYA
jgi:hypothetical protein